MSLCCNVDLQAACTPRSEMRSGCTRSSSRCQQRRLLPPSTDLPSMCPSMLALPSPAYVVNTRSEENFIRNTSIFEKFLEYGGIRSYSILACGSL